MFRGPGVRAKHWRYYILWNFFLSFHHPKGQSLATESNRKVEWFYTTNSNLQNYAAFFERYFLGLSIIQRCLET